MNKIVKIALSTLAIVAIAFSFVAVLGINEGQVAAQAKDAICEGIGLTGGTSDCAQPTGQPTVDSTIKNVINIISIVVGVIAVIMIIIGGLKYITSAGDSSKVSSAKDTILYAVIGLVIVALAQVIVRFVLRQVG